MSLPPLAKTETSHAFLATGVKPPSEIRTPLIRETSYSDASELSNGRRSFGRSVSEGGVDWRPSSAGRLSYAEVVGLPPASQFAQLPATPASRAAHAHVDFSPMAPARMTGGLGMPPVPRTPSPSLPPAHSAAFNGMTRSPSQNKLSEVEPAEAEYPPIKSSGNGDFAAQRRKLQSSQSASRVTLRSQRSLRTINPAYKAKYDPELVILLRDFYNDIIHHGSASTVADGFRTAMQKYNMIDEVTDISYESIFGNPDQPISFRKLLKRMFANATERDLEHMLLLAYPKQEAKVMRLLTEQEKEEFTSLFRSYDVDDSGTLTMREVKNAMKTSALFTGIPHFLSFFESDVFDRGLSLDEFLEGMRLALNSS